MNPNVFLLIIIGYGILSSLIFIKTSGGWSTIYRIFLSGGIYIIGIIMIMVLNKGRIVEPDLLPKGLMLSVIIAQINAIFFNYSDCGDKAGGMIFLERLLGSNNCKEGKQSKVPFAHQLSIGLILLYATFFFYFLWKVWN